MPQKHPNFIWEIYSSQKDTKQKLFQKVPWHEKYICPEYKCYGLLAWDKSMKTCWAVMRLQILDKQQAYVLNREVNVAMKVIVLIHKSRPHSATRAGEIMLMKSSCSAQLSIPSVILQCDLQQHRLFSAQENITLQTRVSPHAWLPPKSKLHPNLSKRKRHLTFRELIWLCVAELLSTLLPVPRPYPSLSLVCHFECPMVVSF